MRNKHTHTRERETDFNTKVHDKNYIDVSFKYIFHIITFKTQIRIKIKNKKEKNLKEEARKWLTLNIGLCPTKFKREVVSG